MSGYVAVGHLFDLEKAQSDKILKPVLGNFVSKFYVETDETLVSRTGFRQFNTYFNNVPVSVESTTTYLRGILKEHDVDDYDFALKVERDVWTCLLSSSELKTKFQTFQQPDCDEKNECFCYQLFCLFNRFCDSKEIPMSLSDESSIFLLEKCGVTGLNINRVRFKLLDFMGYVNMHKSHDVMSAVKNAYDECCRDVLIENRICLKFRPKTGKLHTGMR